MDRNWEGEGGGSVGDGWRDGGRGREGGQSVMFSLFLLTEALAIISEAASQSNDRIKELVCVCVCVSVTCVCMCVCVRVNVCVHMHVCACG